MRQLHGTKPPRVYRRYVRSVCRQRRLGKHCAVGRDFDGSQVHEHFSHETDAKEFEFVLRRRRERVERGLEPIPLPYTFGRYVESWLERRRKIRPRATWEPEEARLRSVWLPHLRHRKLATIFSADIARALERVIRDGRSNATRNRHRAMLHRIFEEALREQPPLVLWNPVKSIEPLPESWRAIERVLLTEAELERYCRSAKGIAREFRQELRTLERDEAMRAEWKKRPEPITATSLAREFGITKSRVQRVLTYRYGPPLVRRKRKSRRNAAIVRRWKQRRSQRVVTFADLGRRYGVSRQRARQIVLGRPTEKERFYRTAGRHWHLLAELFTGGVLRPSEALAVTVDDFEKLEVAIEKIYCKTEKRIIRRTKGQGVGGGYRSLVMPRLRHMLRLAQLTLPKGTPISGGMTYNQVLRLHRMTLKRAGLPRCGLRVFRHSVARILKTRDGFTPSEIQELLGHESIAMTGRYTRTGVSHLAARMGRKRRRVSKR